MAKQKYLVGHKAIVKKVALEEHQIREDGKLRRATALELVLTMVRNQAVQGNIRCIRVLTGIGERYGLLEPERAGYLIVPAKVSEEEFEKLIYEQQAKYRNPADANS